MQARYKYLLNDFLERREEGLAPLFDVDSIESDEREEREIANLIKQMKSQKIIANEIEYLERIVAAGRALDQKDIDTKIQKLLDVLYEPENSDQKFIIFTQYIKTLEVIKKALGGKEYTAEIQGSINVDDRKLQIDKFKNRVRFMICTEAGGEGINLQFASRVINFDMPWNPARLQQRIGRVWRYGQENEVVCYNFFVTNSISDQRVLENLSAKITEIVRTFSFIGIQWRPGRASRGTYLRCHNARVGRSEGRNPSRALLAYWTTSFARKGFVWQKNVLKKL